MVFKSFAAPDADQAIQRFPFKRLPAGVTTDIL